MFVPWIARASAAIRDSMQVLHRRNVDRDLLSTDLPCSQSEAHQHSIGPRVASITDESRRRGAQSGGPLTGRRPPREEHEKNRGPNQVFDPRRQPRARALPALFQVLEELA